MEQEAKELINYIKSVGVEVKTSTKARGNQGFYIKNRIDISKNINKEKIMQTLIHEFAHYIHSKIEPLMEKNGGTIETIFDDSDAKFYLNELINVTKFVDKNSKFETLNLHKLKIKEKINEYEKIIKVSYPDFQRSKHFVDFEKYIKNSKAKYLLRFDRVKLVTKGIYPQVEIYSIDNIEQDFADMPKEFAAYIRLHSMQKRQSRISAKINKLKKYYSKPTELFARLVEGMYLNHFEIENIAPNCTKRFFELLNSGYYQELSGLSKYFM